MHLIIVLAFAAVFWQKGSVRSWSIFSDGAVLTPLLFVLACPGTPVGLSYWLARRSMRRLQTDPRSVESVYRLHGRASAVLRILLLAGFCATLFLTPWPAWFATISRHPALGVLGDLAVLSPLFVGAVALWFTAYPVERQLHLAAGPIDAAGGDSQGIALRPFLDFNIRHHLLTVVVPLTMITFVANLTNGYETAIRNALGFWLAPDVLLGVAAAGVFLFAPFMLRALWRTHSLRDGPLRGALQSMCDRIGFRCRDILVWDTRGQMMNAAVMGIMVPLRFVLLSDALLHAMSHRQIEAVFGHEVGHVRHRHMQQFLLFSYLGWLLACSAMEWTARVVLTTGRQEFATAWPAQAVGAGAALVFWGIGFGVLSRRLERQADLFGARCVTPTAAECVRPCSVHSANLQDADAAHRVCATGAAMFTSTLERVALLNGIPHEEHSWRHASIGKRVRFVHAAAGDPELARGFEQRMQGLRRTMLALAVIGTAALVGYWAMVGEPAILAVPATNA